ncbi:MAG: SDR family oxidoreductase [Pseudomonadota bacterium]
MREGITVTGRCLFSFGHGYSAGALARLLVGAGWRVVGTTRKPERAAELRDAGVEAMLWPADRAALDAALGAATHLLLSAAPGPNGDPLLADHRDVLTAHAGHISWAGYLSTTGVYGDRQGGWVDETARRDAGTARGKARIAAEDAWLALMQDTQLPVHIFRLAGIYGPGRGPFAKVRDGSARRIIKPGQVFSRIHVEDIAAVLAASIARPNPGAAYNVCDDDPAPPQDVIAEAARLLGVPLPPEVPFETAEMSPMARSFYAESKRVSNRRIRDELGVALAYPDYRNGLQALLDSEMGL